MNASPRSPRRWYREPWPWLLMAAPAASIAMGIVLWGIAARSDDGLVASDYYKRGLAINQKVKQARATETPRVGAIVRVDASGAVVVQLEGIDDESAAPAAIRLRVAQPAAGYAERVVVLAREAGGRYVGSIGEASDGRWIVTLESDRWRLPTTTVSGRIGELRLGSAAHRS